MRWPWSELGIAPTQDVVEIKRAYAKRLKTARPDDDAGAYQALREAYDEALEQARFQTRPVKLQLRPEPSPPSPLEPQVPPTTPTEDRSGNQPPWPNADDGFSTPVGTPTLPPQTLSGAQPEATQDQAWSVSDDGFSVTLDVTPAAVPEDGPEETFELPDYIDPETIARSVHRFWEDHGDEDLIELWPRVCADLDALPLHRRAEASEWMAALVLDFPELPAGFVKPLAQYFGWRDDFRVSAMLGTERAHALHEHLRAMGLRGVVSQAEQKAMRHVQTLAQWLRQKRKLRAHLLGILMPEVSLRRWKRASVELLEALGIAGREATGIDAVMRWHPVARGVGLFALCMGLALIFSGDLVVASAHGAFAVGAAVIALLVSLMHVATLERMHMLLPQGIKNWHERAPFVSAAVLVGVPAALAAGLALIPDDGSVWGTGSAVASVLTPLRFFGGWGLALLLPLMVWPQQQHWAILLLSISIVLTLALMPLLPGQPPLLVFVLAQVWTLLASVLLSHRSAGVMAFYRNPFQWLRPRNVWGWVVYVLFFKGAALLLVALSLICIPLSLMVSSLRHGPWAACASMACAGVIAFGIGFGRGNDAGLLIGLVAAIVLLAVLRWIAGRLADRLSH